MYRPQGMLTEQAKIFKALGHPSRLKMAQALIDGERCVGQLQELVGADISTISKHLTVLKEAGVVADEKRGTTVFYRLMLGSLAGFLTCTGDAVRERVERRAAILADTTPRKPSSRVAV